MKKYLCKITVMSVALLLAFAAAQAENLTRTKQKVFKVEKGHKLIVDTRYSDVNIVKHNADEVDINVTIAVEGDSRRDKKLFEAVEVKLTQQGAEIKAVADLPNNLSFKNLKLKFNIKAPVYMHVNVGLKYGNLFLEELQGNAYLDLRYCNFKSDLLAGKNNKMTMAYMDYITIGYLNKALLDVSYSKATIKKATEISGTSAYSEYSIGEADRINLSMSKYDEWEIDELLSFSASSRYAEFEIGYLKKSFLLDGGFGELEIARTSADFQKIELDVTYTDCELNIERGASYTLKAKASYADIEYPANRFKGSYQSKMMSLKIDGTVGESPKGEVIIDTSYGDVEL